MIKHKPGEEKDPPINCKKHGKVSYVEFSIDNSDGEYDIEFKKKFCFACWVEKMTEGLQEF